MVFLVVTASVASLLAVDPFGRAEAQDLGGGLEDIPESGEYADPIPVTELPALPTPEIDDPELAIPEGDFSDPPLPPNASAAQVEAYEEADGEAFDPETSEPVPELTTATREVYENEDGSTTVIVSPQPVNYRDESGEWADIDLGFTEEGDGDVVVDESRFPLELPVEEPGSVAIETRAGTFTMSAPDIAGDADPADSTIDGNAVTVEGDDEILTRVDATTRGFEHSVIVPAASSPSSYRVDIAVPEGLTPQQTENGVEFIDGEGRPVSSFGGGVAFDSADVGWIGAEAPVEVTLVATDVDGMATVEVGVDAAWFADPARVFPVTIDPYFVGNVNGGTGIDTWAVAGNSNPNSTSTQLRVGTVDNGATFARSYLRFVLGQAPDEDTVVAEAHLSLYASESQSCTATGVTLAGLAAGFDANTVWSNAPGTLANPAPTTTASNLGGSLAGGSCPPGRFNLDATALVQQWMNGGQPNLGLRLRAANETLNSNRKIFASGETSNMPKLHITFNTPPTPPVQVLPAHQATVMTTTPTLTATPSEDPDTGTELQYWFSVWTDDSPQWGGQTISSGWLDEPEWTVPAGVLVDSGRYFRAVYVTDGETTTASIRRSFKVNLRLGSGGPSSHEAVGPVGVNLANGNANVSVAGPSFPSVAGSTGVSFAFNSQEPALTGLTGQYFNDDDADGTFDDGDPAVERTDPLVSFGWGQHSPQGGIGSDDFLVRWRGRISVPTTGSWTFGGAHDNGMRIWVDGQQVFNVWNSANFLPAFGTTALSLTAGDEYEIKVEYREQTGDSFVGLWARRANLQYPVPGAWLRPWNPPRESLPAGWTMSTPLAGSGPVEATVTNDLVTFRTADGGTCCAFLRSVNDGTWSPGPGHSGRLQEDDDGRFTLHSADGTVYSFLANGLLDSATTPADSDNRAAWAPDYGLIGDLPRLMSMTDPVGPASGQPGARSIEFVYRGSGNCPTIPDPTFTAWSELAIGRLCAIDYWDGQQTRVFYRNGQISRIVNIGPDRDNDLALVTDFSYDSSADIDSVRSPFAADVLASGAWDPSNSWVMDTEIAYDSNRRVAHVKQPRPFDLPDVADAVRPLVEFGYAGTTTTIESSGFSREVVHDSAGRLISSTGIDGLTTATTWDTVEERVTSVLDRAGMRTNTRYDDYGNPVETWGPAPDAWFNGNFAPQSNQARVPHATAAFDQVQQNGSWVPLEGLAASWWNNVHLATAPAIMRHGIAGGTGEVSANWGTNAPSGLTVTDNFSGRLTGWITPATEDDYDFRFLRDGKVRLIIDDDVVIDEWTASTDVADGAPIHLTAEPHPIVIEFADTTGAASIDFRWSTGGPWSTVPGSVLRPGYGNLTTETRPNGQTRHRSYSSPHLGAQTAFTTSSGGLTLSQSAAYEGASTDAFRRPISTTNAAGNTTTTDYYGANQAMPPPDACGGGPAVNQGGQPMTVTSPDPDGAGGDDGRVEEFRYDEAGRRIASRVIGAGGWACTSYDDRGRPVITDIPAYNGAPARTITHDYAVDHGVGDNPLVSSVTDPASAGNGTVTTTVDLLGRTRTVIDVWNKTTEVAYDDVGRVVRSSGAGGVLENVYDPVTGLLDTVALDEQVIADVTGYDSLRRLTGVNYPAGTNQRGNGTGLEEIHYDDLGRTDRLSWAAATGSQPLTAHERTFDDHGRVIDEVIDTVDPFSGQNFEYDGLGRLVQARVPGHHLSYGYAATNSCGASLDAGKNTNRTSMTDLDTATSQTTSTTYCYDHADRLTSTSVTPPTGSPETSDFDYDGRGNTISIGEATLGYDAAGRHVSAGVEGGESVTYLRGPDGAIVQRTVGEQALRFSAGPAGVGLILDANSDVRQRIVSLPGGVSVTINDDDDTESWSYPNLAGSAVATADETGVKVGGTNHYDPFGNPLNGLPDNRDGADVGWGGAATEEIPGLPRLIQLGARVYAPELGRFLQVDPVRDASANAYDYAAGDPVNYSDQTGTDPRPNHIGIFDPPPPVVSCWGWECSRIQNSPAYAGDPNSFHSTREGASVDAAVDQAVKTAIATAYLVVVYIIQVQIQAALFIAELSERYSGPWYDDLPTLGAWADAFSLVGNVFDWTCAIAEASYVGYVHGQAACAASDGLGIAATAAYYFDGDQAAFACSLAGTTVGLLSRDPFGDFAAAAIGYACL